MNSLTASIFSSFPSVAFGFSTRNGGVSPEPYRLNMSFSVGDDSTNVMENQRRFLSHLGIRLEDLAIPKSRCSGSRKAGQVHGDTVVRVLKPGIYENCDALITNEKNVFLRVSVADCLPIFLFDPVSQSVAAVHAGWRGCIHRIVEKTVLRMIQEFSAEPDEMRLYIGPSARSCCYEVGEEVASHFDQRFLIQKTQGRPHLNMLGFTMTLLTDAGIQHSCIEISPHCTICTPSLFHSYRRDGVKSGRMMGVIGLKRVDF